MVELTERLVGKGCDVKIYDPNVTFSRLIGANRAYMNQHLPHLAYLLEDDVDIVVEHSEVLVVGTRESEVVAAIDRAPEGSLVVDLVRLPDADSRRSSSGYVALGW
jgi:GDP-mannose 6-dehydrogenase